MQKLGRRMRISRKEEARMNHPKAVLKGKWDKREAHRIGLSWIRPQVVPLESCMTLGQLSSLFVHHSRRKD